MNKSFSILVGTLLVLMGGLALMFTLGMPMLGWNDWFFGPWRLWPLVVVSVGLLFMLAPLLSCGHRGLGGLFIPGMPILTTGGILLLASVSSYWHIWSWLWPLEVLAVAAGFLFAAIYMRLIWLLIPAIIIGLNGLVLQFCAITGLWHLWSVLWTIEPLAVGLSLLIVGLGKRVTPLFLAGAALCSLAGIGLVGMTAITLSGGWIFSVIGPAVLILTGLVLLLWGMLPRSSSPRPTAA
jgi:hypothetical protein